MTLEQDFVWIEIWSGSIVLKNSVHIKTLTGYVPSSYVYSINNYMIIVIQAGDISATSIPGITFSWIQGTVNIPKICINLSSVQKMHDNRTIPFFIEAGIQR